MPLSDDQLGGLTALVSALGTGADVWTKDREQRRKLDLERDTLMERLRAENAMKEDAAQSAEKRSIVHDVLMGYGGLPLQDIGNVSAYLGASLEDPGATEANVRAAQAAPAGGVGPAALPPGMTSLLRGYQALGGAKKIIRPPSGGGQPKRFEDWWAKYVTAKQKAGGMFGAIQDVRLPSNDPEYAQTLRSAAASLKDYLGRGLTAEEIRTLKARLTQTPGVVHG